MKLYTHKELGKEIRFISGYYSFEEEIKLAFRGRDVLCAVAICELDNSCCGRWGCYLIEVPGFLVSEASRKDESGHLISEVEAIENAEEREGIKVELQKLYPYSQVNFP